MSLTVQIPKPVLFNPLKHHRNYILKFLKAAGIDEIHQEMNSVCHNYIDFYTGMLTPVEIATKVIQFLNSEQIADKDSFNKWISENNNYRIVELSDGSFWVIRESIDAMRFVHIHPAKSGPLTIRFKGSTFKTAYSLWLSYQKKNIPFTLELINQARLKVGLSPVKRLEKNKGILKCWELLFK